jgi:hypothetical protein
MPFRMGRNFLPSLDWALVCALAAACFWVPCCLAGAAKAADTAGGGVGKYLVWNDNRI